MSFNLGTESQPIIIPYTNRQLGYIIHVSLIVRLVFVAALSGKILVSHRFNGDQFSTLCDYYERDTGKQVSFIVAGEQGGEAREVEIFSWTFH